METQIQSSHLPPAQPKYILRGHTAQIHAVCFLRSNTRILTGDADGWVVLWNIVTKRAVGVWKAHGSTILGLGSWDAKKIITHGRDSKLYIWQLGLADEKSLSRTLPIEDASVEGRPRPKALHELNVNTLNFCSFAMCHTTEGEMQVESESKEILIATPGVEDGHINITSLPSETRIGTIPGPKGLNTGMVMALGLMHQSGNKGKSLQVLAGYESGHACIWTQQTGTSSFFQVSYLHKTHAQPILAIGIAPSLGVWFTSAADAIIARHPLRDEDEKTKTIQTKHAGQQGVAVRNDGKIFATAGWDGRMRVYGTGKGMRELGVLKWHGEGCYAVAFADVEVEGEGGEEGREVDFGQVDGSLTVAEKREEVAGRTHWLAAGSKDGKVSLWEIY